MDDKSSEQGKCTLFVGNLPEQATNDDLEKEFSEIGPIKRCFVLKDKRCGFVVFALREDANSAVDKVKTLHGKPLRLSFARGKQSTHTQKNDKKADVKHVFRTVDKVEKKDKGENKETNTKQKQKSFGKMIIRKQSVKKNDKGENNEINATQKRKFFGKVIVRNLSYKVTEKDVRRVFEKFGKVIDVDLPKTPDGTLKGFGFVRMENEQVSSNAIAGINSQEILGRPVAVDWAVSQKEYKKLKSGKSVYKEGEDDQLNYTTDNEKNKPDKTTPAAKNLKTKRQMKKTSVNMDTYNLEEGFSQAVSSQSDEDDDKDSQIDENDDNDSQSDEDGDNDSQSDEDDDDEENMTASSEDEYDETNDQEKNSSGAGAKKRKKQRNSEQYSDIKEGKTLFVRNIGFDTTQEQLTDAFSKFGKLQYAIICVDPVTEHSKGTGFVKFVKKESADECISKTVMQSEDGGITLDGHKLWVSIALSKEDTMKIGEDKTKKKKDNRNLYMAREGLIRPGTLAAEGVSQQDMKTRMHLEERKGRLLRNLHMFVSDNRLSVWNIPLSMTEKTLKGIFTKAGGPGAIVSKVKIMRSQKKFDASGMGQSKGFGFVGFKDSEHAIRALRATNNNPDIFTPSSRPIVEFTLENKAALKVKERRLENSQRKNKQIQERKKSDNISGKPKALRKPAPSSDKTASSRSFVGTKAESLDNTKSKILPSHFGPKIRHKKRPGADAAKALKNTKKIQRRRREEMLIAQTKRRNRKEMPLPKKVKQSEDNLDKLVTNYRKKLKSKNKHEGEKKKWFKKSN